MFKQYKSLTTNYFYIESSEYPYFNAKIYKRDTHFEIEAGNGFEITDLAYAVNKEDAERKAFAMYMELCQGEEREYKENDK